MEQSTSEDKFTMTEPRQHFSNSEFAFWLATSESRLFEFVASITCVSHVTVDEDSDRALVDIRDEFDADEAWHFIRSELEGEVNYVHLDPIWERALWLL
jgi:hypothetical protein